MQRALFRQARFWLAVVTALGAVLSSHPALARRGIQLSPDGRRVLVNKNVSGEQWAIVLNRDDGTVTGNVFFPNGNDPAFIFCQPLDQPNTFTCSGAGSCTTETCVDQYAPLGDVTLPADFFQATDTPSPNPGLALLGVYRETQENFAPAADRLPDAAYAFPDAGSTVILGVTTTVPRDINGDGDLDGGFLGLQNNLDQGINVQSVRVQIFIAGSNLNNPVVTDVVPFPISMPPATVDRLTGVVVTPSLSYTQTVLVGPDVLASLARNQTLLPPLPFDMSVVMSITATNDSGEPLNTNTITYPVTVSQ